MSQKTNIQKMIESHEAKAKAAKSISDNLDNVLRFLKENEVEDPCEVINEIVESWQADQE